MGSKRLKAVAVSGTLPIPVADREEIVRRVKALHDAKVNLPVLVSGDRKASLGAGIGLVADLKAAGVEKASFQVKGE